MKYNINLPRRVYYINLPRRQFDHIFVKMGWNLLQQDLSNCCSVQKAKNNDTYLQSPRPNFHFLKHILHTDGNTWIASLAAIWMPLSKR